MSEHALGLKARRLYRFFPAFIALEERCLRMGYKVGENLEVFCDSLVAGASNKLTVGVMEFYDDISLYSYRLRDWNYDFLADMDIPQFQAHEDDGWNYNPRPTHEWDGEPREDEVMAICEDETNPHRYEQYIQYERGLQRYYAAKANEFTLI